MAEGIKVPVSLEVVQSSITQLRQILNNLKPESGAWKELSKIIQNMQRDANQLQVTMSRPFNSQKQFGAAEKSINKIENALESARITMSRLNFSDIRLDADQQQVFDGLKQQLVDIQNEATQFKAGLKSNLQMSDIWDDIKQMDPNAATHSFDDIIDAVEKKVSRLQRELEKAKKNLSDFQPKIKLAENTKKFFENKNNPLREGLGEDFSKFFQDTKNGLRFQKGGKNAFFEWVSSNLTLTDAQIEQLKNTSTSKLEAAFKNLNISEILKKANSTIETGQQKSQNVNSANAAYNEGLRTSQALGNSLDGLNQKQEELAQRSQSVNANMQAFANTVTNTTRNSEQANNAFNQTAVALGNVRKSASEANNEWLKTQRITANINSMKSMVTNFMGFTQVLNLVKRGVREAIQHIHELDDVMNSISVVTDMSTGDLWDQVDTYSKMASQYGVTIKGAYEVSKIYYQQGLETSDVMTLTNETLKLAKISGLDYAQTTDYMTTALRGFKMEMSDASTIVDVYSALASTTAVSSEELAVAMSKTASSMESVGSTFQETSAMIATMVAVTRESATNIGSALKSIAARYGEMKKDPLALKDSEGEALSYNKVDAALQSVGITLKDSEGEFRNFTDVILELSEVWDQLDSTQQRYIATQFAGNRQQSRFLALISNKDLLKQNIDTAEDAEGTGAAQAEKTLDSITSKLNQVKVAYQQFYTSVGLEGLFKNALGGLREYIEYLNQLPKALGTDIPVAAIGMVANLINAFKLLGTGLLAGLSKMFERILPTNKIATDFSQALTEGGESGIAAVAANVVNRISEAGREAGREAAQQSMAPTTTQTQVTQANADSAGLTALSSQIAEGEKLKSAIDQIDSSFTVKLQEQLNALNLNDAGAQAQLTTFINNLLNSLGDAGTQIRTLMQQTGENVVAGLVVGLMQSSGQAQDAANQVGAAVIQGVNSGAGCNSPSVLAAITGANVIAGLTEGLTSATSSAVNAAIDAGTSVTDALESVMTMDETGLAQFKDSIMTQIEALGSEVTPQAKSEMKALVEALSLDQIKSGQAPEEIYQWLGLRSNTILDIGKKTAQQTYSSKIAGVQPLVLDKDGLTEEQAQYYTRREKEIKEQFQAESEEIENDLLGISSKKTEYEEKAKAIREQRLLEQLNSGKISQREYQNRLSLPFEIQNWLNTEDYNAYDALLKQERKLNARKEQVTSTKTANGIEGLPGLTKYGQALQELEREKTDQAYKNKQFNADAATTVAGYERLSETAAHDIEGMHKEVNDTTNAALSRIQAEDRRREESQRPRSEAPPSKPTTSIIPEGELPNLREQREAAQAAKQAENRARGAELGRQARELQYPPSTPVVSAPVVEQVAEHLGMGTRIKNRISGTFGRLFGKDAGSEKSLEEIMKERSDANKAYSEIENKYNNAKIKMQNDLSQAESEDEQTQIKKEWKKQEKELNKKLSPAQKRLDRANEQLENYKANHPEQFKPQQLAQESVAPAKVPVVVDHSSVEQASTEAINEARENINNSEPVEIPVQTSEDKIKQAEANINDLKRLQEINTQYGSGKNKQEFTEDIRKERGEIVDRLHGQGIKVATNATKSANTYIEQQEKIIAEQQPQEVVQADAQAETETARNIESGVQGNLQPVIISAQADAGSAAQAHDTIVQDAGQPVVAQVNAEVTQPSIQRTQNALKSLTNNMNNAVTTNQRSSTANRLAQANMRVEAVQNLQSAMEKSQYKKLFFRSNKKKQQIVGNTMEAATIAGAATGNGELGNLQAVNEELKKQIEYKQALQELNDAEAKNIDLQQKADALKKLSDAQTQADQGDAGEEAQQQLQAAREQAQALLGDGFDLSSQEGTASALEQVSSALESSNNEVNQLENNLNRLTEVAQREGQTEASAAIAARNARAGVNAELQQQTNNMKKYGSIVKGVSSVMSAATMFIDKESQTGQQVTGGMTALSGLTNIAGGFMSGGWVGGLMSLATSAPMIFSGIQQIIGAKKETESERLGKVLEKLEETSAASQKKAQESKSQYKNLQQSTSRIDELSKSRFSSKEAAEEYQSAVNALTESFPELISGFDEMGNAIYNSALAAKELAKAQQQAADDAYEAATDEANVKQTAYKKAQEDNNEFLTTYTSVLEKYIDEESGLYKQKSGVVGTKIFTTVDKEEFARRGKNGSKYDVYPGGAAESLFKGNALYRYDNDIYNSSEGYVSNKNIRIVLDQAAKDAEAKKELPKFDYNVQTLELLDDLGAHSLISDFGTTTLTKRKEWVESLKEGTDYNKAGLTTVLDLISEINGLSTVKEGKIPEENLSSLAEKYRQLVYTLDGLDEKSLDWVNSYFFSIDPKNDTNGFGASDLQSAARARSAELNKIDYAYQEYFSSVTQSIISWMEKDVRPTQQYQFLEKGSTLQGIIANYYADLLISGQAGVKYDKDKEYGWNANVDPWLQHQMETDDSRLNQLKEFYNALGETNQELFDQMISDNYTYSFNDLKASFGKNKGWTPEVEKVLEKGYIGLNDTISNNIALMLNAYKITNSDFDKIVRDSSKIDTYLEQNVIGKMLQQYGSLRDRGMELYADQYLSASTALLEEIESKNLDSKSRVKALELINKYGISNEEQISQIISAIGQDENLSSLKDELEAVLKATHSNLSLALQSSISNLSENWKDVMDNITKGIKGVDVVEKQQLLEQAKLFQLDLEDADFELEGSTFTLKPDKYLQMVEKSVSSYQLTIDNYWSRIIEVSDALAAITEAYNNGDTDALATVAQSQDLVGIFDTVGLTYDSYITQDTSGNITYDSKKAMDDLREAFDATYLNYLQYVQLVNQIENEATVSLMKAGEFNAILDNTVANRPLYKLDGSVFTENEQKFAHLTMLAKKNTKDWTEADLNDKNVKTAVEGIRSSYSKFISDILANGLENIDWADYEYITKELTQTEFGLDGTQDYRTYVTKLGKAAGMTRKEINESLVKAVQKDAERISAASFEELEFINHSQFKANLSSLQTLADTYDLDLNDLMNKGVYNAIEDMAVLSLKELEELIKQTHPDFDLKDIENLNETIQESFENTMAQLANAVKDGLGGSLSLKNANSLQKMVSDYGLKNAANNPLTLQFTRGKNGYKLAIDSAKQLYTELKKVDELTAQIVLDELNESLDQSIYKAGELGDALSDVARIRATSESDQFNFMSGNIPGGQNNPLNYWENWAQAIKVFQDAASAEGATKGHVKYQDFYNIVMEMGRLSELTDTSLNLAGISVDNMQKAAKLIEDAAHALDIVDGTAMVNLGNIGINFEAGAEGMSTNIQDGINALADGQIEMLDGMIALMETLVQMQKLGEVDFDKNGIFDIHDIFEWNTDNDTAIAQFTRDWDEARTALRDLAEADPNGLGKVLETIKVNGHSMKEIINAGADELEKIGISLDEYANIMMSLIAAAQSEDFDLNNLFQSIQEILAGSGFEGELQMGDVKLVGKQGVAVTVAQDGTATAPDGTKFKNDDPEVALQQAIDYAKASSLDAMKGQKATAETDGELASAVYKYNENTSVEVEIINNGYVITFDVGGKKYTAFADNEASANAAIATMNQYLNISPESTTTTADPINFTVRMGADVLLKVEAGKVTTEDEQAKAAAEQAIENAKTGVATAAKQQGGQSFSVDIDNLTATIKPGTEVSVDMSGAKLVPNETTISKEPVTISTIPSLQYEGEDIPLDLQNKALTPTGYEIPVKADIGSLSTSQDNLTLDLSGKTINSTKAVVTVYPMNTKFADDATINVDKPVPAKASVDNLELTYAPADAEMQALLKTVPEQIQASPVDEAVADVNHLDITLTDTTGIQFDPNGNQIVTLDEAIPAEGEVSDLSVILPEGKNATLSSTQTNLTVDMGNRAFTATNMGEITADASNILGKATSIDLQQAILQPNNYTVGEVNIPLILPAAISTKHVWLSLKGIQVDVLSTSVPEFNIPVPIITHTDSTKTLLDFTGVKVSPTNVVIQRIPKLPIMHPGETSATMSFEEVTINPVDYTIQPLSNIDTLTTTDNNININLKKNNINVSGAISANAEQLLPLKYTGSALPTLDMEGLNIDVTNLNVDSVGEKIVADIQQYLTGHPIKPALQVGYTQTDTGEQSATTPVLSNPFEPIINSLNEITAEPINALTDALGKITTDKIDAIQTAQEKIDHNKVDDIQTAQNKINHNKVDDIQTAQNNISAGKIIAVKEAANSISPIKALAAASAINNIKVKDQSATLKVKASVSSAKGNLGALAKGNAALASGTKTLMGELGPELVVSHGQYFLAGANGTEFVNLDKDAIVFNHLQTQRLLAQGGIGSRGIPFTNEMNAVSYAKGNVHGPAHVTDSTSGSGGDATKMSISSYHWAESGTKTLNYEVLSLAKGTMGPAMASAQAALSALKQLKAMWESLKNASMKDLAEKGGGGGGGGGGNENNQPANFLKDLEQWYNWLQQIAQLEADITKEEAKRSKLQSDMVAHGKDYYASQKKTLDALKDSTNVYQSLYNSQKEYFKSRVAELNNSAFKALYTFSNETGQLYYDQRKQYGENKNLTAFQWLSELVGRDAITGQAKHTAKDQYDMIVKAGFGFAMQYDSSGNEIFSDDMRDEKDKNTFKDEAYVNAVQAFWDKIEADKEEMQSLHDSIEEYDNKIIKNQEEINQILKDIEENQIAVEQKVLKAVEEIRQRAIDNAQKEKEAIEKASKNLIDGLSQQLQKERDMYQNQQNADDLSKLQRQLAILQRSGGSASQIADLQSQISDKMQNAYFDAQQDEIDALQEANDNQIKRLDDQIKLMTEQLEYEKEHGLLWKQVYDVLAQDANSIVDFISGNTAEYWNKSTTELQKVIREDLFEVQRFKEFSDNINKLVKEYSDLKVGQAEKDERRNQAMNTYDAGGMVEETGVALLHAKEGVLTPEQTAILRNEILSSKPNSLLSLLTDFSSAYNDISNSTSSIPSASASGIIIENATVEMNVSQLASDYDAQRAGEQALDRMLEIARKTQAQNRIGR